MKRAAIFSCILLSFLLMALVLNGATTKPLIQSEPDTYLAYNVAREALKAIKKGDYKTLSESIHPEKGVVFAPFSFIDRSEQLVFTSVEASYFNSDSNKYTWGFYDQSPAPIELTASDYFKRFVYDKDFLYANQIGINNIVRQGNSIENIKEAFPDSIFVDFHDSGSAEYDGLDWASLKIAMERYNGEFKIVAIIHSSYTL